MESTLSYRSISLNIRLLGFEWQLSLILLIFLSESVVAFHITLLCNFFWLIRTKLAHHLHDFSEGLLLTLNVKIRHSFN